MLRRSRLVRSSWSPPVNPSTNRNLWSEIKDQTTDYKDPDYVPWPVFPFSSWVITLVTPHNKPPLPYPRFPNTLPLLVLIFRSYPDGFSLLFLHAFYIPRIITNYDNWTIVDRLWLRPLFPNHTNPVPPVIDTLEMTYPTRAREAPPTLCIDLLSYRNRRGLP